MASAVQNTDNPADRLAKLLPAEVTGLYLSVKGLCDASSAPAAEKVLMGSVPLILICGVAYLFTIRKISNRIHVCFYCLAFLVWIATIESERIGIAISERSGIVPLVASIASIILSFLIPIIIPSEKLASQAGAPR